MLQLILSVAMMIVSGTASVFAAIALTCLWCPWCERFVGFCLVQFGLMFAYGGLKLSVFGGRMVDSSRGHRPASVEQSVSSFYERDAKRVVFWQECTKVGDGNDLLN